MDNLNIDSPELSVNEGSFWHTNMDLYFGYQPGEMVEVEHEPNKYWLATIKYSYRQLISLEWIGNYGNFWMDLTNTNPSSSAIVVSEGYYTPKRIFPIGYHLQSQLKSQFTLEQPTKVLNKPTLYNPHHDPYGNIENIDDLLALDLEDMNPKDAFNNQIQVSIGETASLVMAKCNAQISFGQEDVDELEAALQNLTEIVSEQQPDAPISISKPGRSSGEIKLEIINSNETDATKTEQSSVDDKEVTYGDRISGSSLKSIDKQENDQDSCKRSEVESYIELCKSIQESAINLGKYNGYGEHKDKVFYMKPKQFFDIGGANHERLLLPGTLLEICYSEDRDEGLMIFHWFAIVIKNQGGRLTLRWFLCDEPKFKQGRLELKSCHSQYVIEEEDTEDASDDRIEGDEGTQPRKVKPLAKDITFSMHFCDPRIHSISYAKSNGRTYKLPHKLVSIIEESIDQNVINIEKEQIESIFDSRRINLDKDRPLIDHLLSMIKTQQPNYLSLASQIMDKSVHRGVLLSTPKTTRVFRGSIIREIEPNVLEIHSEPISESGDVIKFVYPYDSSYSLLPLDWAIKNEDCLSVPCSRNPSPTTFNRPSSCAFVEGTSPNEPSKNPSESESQSNASENSSIKNEENILKFEGDDDAQQAASKGHEEEPKDQITTKPACSLDCTFLDHTISRFRIMDQMEVIHPSSHVTICSGRIRKVAFPLLWIQLSSDSYTLLPFNSTSIYPTGWGIANEQNVVSLLPPLKRIQQPIQVDKKKKKIKLCDDQKTIDDQRALYEKEKFDLGSINEKPMDIDYILNENVMYDRIYFNHKCFTGPSLSKGKICSLPQYVGPGPLRLVMEEVVMKVISVAYVPPRILNDLSSKTFEELLIARNLTNTVPIEFKAKYQKRTHREEIRVCLSPDDVAAYCECICEHLKCCYNLFGPNLYDGDDCPGHCRALTKSNKFMKRATYYREKARLGEFTSDSNTTKKSTTNQLSKTTRANYAGRGSSDSSASSSSRSEQVVSRASSAGEDIASGSHKENLDTVLETGTVDKVTKSLSDDSSKSKEIETSESISEDPDIGKKRINPNEINKSFILSSIVYESVFNLPMQSEFEALEYRDFNPEEWTVEEVALNLERCRLDRFKSIMVSEVST